MSASGGRKFVPITVDELKKKIKAKVEKLNPEMAGEFHWLPEMISTDPTLSKDLSKVEFDFENWSIDAEQNFGPAEIVGYRTLLNGMPFLGVSAGGDWETPLVFIIYWDGKSLRAYIPTDGNPWNTDTKMAYGNDEDADDKNRSKRFPGNDDPDVDARKVLADIQARIVPR